MKLHSNNQNHRIRTYPGEVLREEFLLPFRLSAHALALAIQVPARRITEIIKEKKSVTVDTALRLARYFGTSPKFWINLQSNYDLSLMASQKAQEIEYIIPYSKRASA